jgi:hypothetical protein
LLESRPFKTLVSHQIEAGTGSRGNVEDNRMNNLQLLYMKGLKLLYSNGVKNHINFITTVEVLTLLTKGRIEGPSFYSCALGAENV